MVKQLNETICFGNSTLSRMQEEAIATVVAVANRCRYGALTHGGFFRRHCGDPALASHLLDDYSLADLDPQIRQMLDFAVRLTLEPGSFNSEDLEGLRRAGFDQEEIVSIILITSLFNFMNRLATGFGVEAPPGYINLVESWLSGPAAQESWLVPTVESQPDESPAVRLGIDVPRGQQSDTEEMPFAGNQQATRQNPSRRDRRDIGQDPSAGDQQVGVDYPSPTNQHDTGRGPFPDGQPNIQLGPSPSDRQDIGADASVADQKSVRVLENHSTQENGQSVERFISECCTVASGESTTARDLYVSYLRWCDDNGEHALLQRNFGMQLTQLAYGRRRRSGGRHCWQGIGLKSQEK